MHASSPVSPGRRHRSTRFARPVMLGLLAFLVLLVMVALLSLRYSRERQEATRWVEHTDQVIETLYRVRMHVTDLETGKRGYLLTFDESYLAPHGVSAEDVRNDVGALQLLVADNPAQRAGAARLAELLAAKLREIEEVLAAGRSSGQAAATAIIQARASKRLMDEIRSQTDAMLEAEHRLLMQRQERSTSAERDTAWLTAAAVLLALLFASAAGLQAQREVRRRRRGAEQLRFLRDLSEQRAAELERSQAALSRAKSDAERANQAKSRFLAAAGHDLMQPLQIITMALDYLERCAGPAGAPHVHRAAAAIATMDHAFGQFTEAAKLSAGTVTPQREAIDLGPLLADICDQLRPVAAAKGLRLRLVPSTLQISTDPWMLETILRNLIGNAIKYTRDGGILVGVRRKRHSLALQVCDTGMGIPADKLEVIFDEFHRLTPGTGDGVGLGLSIVNHVTDLLGYRLSVRSTPEKGSCFGIEVPCSSGGCRAAESSWPATDGRRGRSAAQAFA